MVRTSLVALVLLAGCQPVVHVSPLVPSVPDHRGVRVGAEGNLLASQTGARLDASPVEAVSVFARRLRTSNDANSFRLSGGEVGVVAERRMERGLRIDGSLSAGWDRVASEGTVRGEPPLGVSDTVDAGVRRLSGHVGAWGVSEDPGLGFRTGPLLGFRAGPALRISRIAVVSPRRRGEGPEVTEARGLLVEPIVRAALTYDRLDAEVQTGVTFVWGDALREQYDVVPLLLGARLGVRLF
ncbi:MAG: hypothetical protein AAF594_07010 [Bacteroidota bacterium]